jgi:hypothetical protein
LSNSKEFSKIEVIKLKEIFFNDYSEKKSCGKEGSQLYIEKVWIFSLTYVAGERGGS